MPIESKSRYEITLQPFFKNFDDYSIEFPCLKCKSTVIATPKAQKEASNGGIGHKCSYCDTYYALFNCPKCNEVTGVDDKEWEVLSSPEGINCPNCDAILYRNKETWRPTLMTMATMAPSLTLWSSSKEEANYLSYIQKHLSTEQQQKIAIRHHSIGVRMNAAKQSLNFLTSEKWYFPLNLSNTPNSDTKESETLKTPFSYEFHDHIFGFVNNLRSALDMLSQEVASVYLSNYDESKVDYLSINNKLPTKQSSLKRTISGFRTSDSFIYLNKLRNVCQHRRIPLLVTVGSFDATLLDSIRPTTIHALAKVQLPKNPYDKPEKISVNSGIELFSYIKRTYKNIELHIFDIYAKSTDTNHA